MDCFVYVLGTATRNGPLTYVGWTHDVARRLAQHNAGKGARFTRGRAWILLHQERLATRGEAMSREWHLKRDRKFRKQLVLKLRPKRLSAAATPARRRRASASGGPSGTASPTS
jgi:putative endonuclease